MRLTLHLRGGGLRLQLRDLLAQRRVMAPPPLAAGLYRRRVAPLRRKVRRRTLPAEVAIETQTFSEGFAPHRSWPVLG